MLIIGIIAVPALPRAQAASGTYFDNVVVILMENNAINNIYNQVPFQTTLANTYTLSTAFSQVGSPSEPNYLGLFAGNTFYSSDGNCCFQLSNTNLVDRLEAAGLTWTAFAEDASGSGTCGFNPPRAGDHFPFIDFSDMQTAARCSNFQSTSSTGDPEFIAALNQPNPSNFIWLTPNDQDNAHDSSPTTGDNYLSTLVPQILSSATFTTKRAALFVVYDEANGYGSSSNCCVYASWSGPVVKKAFQSNNAYSLYSWLHTIEQNWGLSTITSHDAGAPVMTEFFGLSAPPPLATSFSFNPSSPAVNAPVSFTAGATGGTPPYAFSWSFGDGTTGAGSTVTHVYAAAGTYSVIETVSDAATHTATSTLPVTVTPPQPLSATFTVSPAQPTNGTAATFTATATGGTSPYSFTWSFGDGVSGTTSPATHVYAVPGAFTVSLIATDAKAATFTTSKSVTVIQSVKSGAFPYVRAWDGILPTESTADLQATFTLLQQRGYNAARISLVDPVLGVSTFNQAAFDNLLAIAKQHNIWLIMDDHEYGITNEAAWLSFWSPIITAYKNEPMIIWQPRNEPSNSAAQLSTFYQDWITQDRNLGDNHWIIVSISYGQFGAPNDSTFLSAFPTVTDPLNQVAYDFHDYYFYQYNPAWSVSDAQAYAANVPLAVLSLESFKNAPAIVSEFGADPSGGGPSPPDAIDTNCSCQYSPESLAYVVAVVQGLDNIKGAYGLWEAGDWDGSGTATGAMTVWGQSIPMPGPVSTGATYALTFQGYDFDGANEETITMNGNLVASVPSVLTTANGATWIAFTFDITSFVVQGANTISFTHANSDCLVDDQVRNLVVSNQTNTIYSNATAENINTATNCTYTLTYHFTIGVGAPSPPPSTIFTFLPSTPIINSPVTFTATTTGGTAPYTISWSFGDGATGTGATTAHTYTTAQSFTVSETATDSSSPSQTATSSKGITVTAPPPLSTSFTFLPSSPVVNSPLTFTAITTGGTTPYTIKWNFGDGTTGTGTSVTHAYSSAQSFTATETATDSSSPSQNAAGSQTITVSAPPPLSTSFTFLPASPVVNTPVTFTTTTSGGTSPYSVTWNFGDGSSGTGTSVTHTFTSAKSFTVKETATDLSTPTQTATSTQSLTVVATPPLSATLQVSSSSPQVGQTVTFTASATGGTAPYTYTIAFGDGTTGTGSTTTHAYSIAGSYTAKVTVTDSASPKTSIAASKIVNVQALVPPALSLPGNQTIVAGTWINFTVTAVSLNTGGTVSLSATGLPAGASFNQATGVFSWKPSSSSSQIGSHTVVFTAMDSSYPSTPTSKPMEIQVNQAAPGGSNGGSGGSGGNPNGSCTLCGIFPRISTNTGLLLVGGFLGLVSTLVVFTIRARMSLERTKRRLEIRRR